MAPHAWVCTRLQWRKVFICQRPRAINIVVAAALVVSADVAKLEHARVWKIISVQISAILYFFLPLLARSPEKPRLIEDYDQEYYGTS